MRIALNFSLPEFYLFFQREGKNLNTSRRAASEHAFVAIITLDKEQVAVIVGTIDMTGTGLAALVANTDDVFSDGLAKPVVEHKIFPDEPGFESFFLYLAGIVNDAAIQLVDIFKAVVAHISAG